MRSPRTTIRGTFEDAPRQVKPRQTPLYPRPVGVRPGLNTIQQMSTGERYVSTDDEFKRAIGEIAALYSDSGDIDGASGGKIVIASSWATDGYVVPPECAGLVIAALPGCRLFAKSGPGTVTLFSVQAADVTIERVTAAFDTYGFACFCSADLGTLAGASVSASRLVVDRCVVSSARTYDDNSGGLAAMAQITRNRHVATGKTDAIYVDSDSCLVDGNELQAFSTLFSVITVGANGGRCRIVNNDVDHGIIRTSASAGENAIWDNMNTLTIDRHPTDSRGGNT